LCTSPDTAVRNPAGGVALVAKLGPADGLSSSGMDTVAACHAAAGDFEAAVRWQTLAVQRQEVFPDGPGILARMRTRLEKYREKQPYLEKPGDE